MKVVSPKNGSNQGGGGFGVKLGDNAKAKAKKLSPLNQPLNTMASLINPTMLASDTEEEVEDEGHLGVSTGSDMGLNEKASMNQQNQQQQQQAYYSQNLSRPIAGGAGGVNMGMSMQDEFRYVLSRADMARLSLPVQGVV
jgi:hypothetical protein